MGQEKLGYEDVYDLVKLGLSLGQASEKALEDGKLSFSDGVYLVDVLKHVPAAINGIGNVSAELNDLSEDEKAELMKRAKEEFELDDDYAEEIVEESLSVGLSMAKLVAVILKGRKKEA